MKFPLQKSLYHLERIAANLRHGNLEYSSYVSEHLRNMIRLNRIESFKYLFSRTILATARSYASILHLTNLLGLAIWEHRPEICDFLMAIDFIYQTAADF